MKQTNQYILSHAAGLVALGVCAIWGETFVSSKILLDAGMLPANIFFLRFVLAYVGICLFSHGRLWANSWRDELLLLMLGMLGGSIYFLSENMALIYSTPSNVAILVGSTPLITALLLAIFYREERMSRRQIIGSVIAFMGMALVIFNGEVVLHLNPKGDVLAIGAAVTWGFYSLVIKRLSATYDTLFITRKVFAYGIISIVPYIAFVEPLHADLSLLAQPVVWGNFVYLGLVASMLCYFAWNWALKRLGTVRATNIIYLQPFFTMLISYIVLNERITLMAICGTLVLMAGMAILSKTKKERK